MILAIIIVWAISLYIGRKILLRDLGRFEAFDCFLFVLFGPMTLLCLLSARKSSRYGD